MQTGHTINNRYFVIEYVIDHKHTSFSLVRKLRFEALAALNKVDFLQKQMETNDNIINLDCTFVVVSFYFAKFIFLHLQYIHIAVVQLLSKIHPNVTFLYKVNFYTI